MRLRLLLKYLLSLPKSFYVSWRLTDFVTAMKIPILVHWSTRTPVLVGKVIFNKVVPSFAILKFGFNGSPLWTNRGNPPIIEINGVIELNGKAIFGKCSKLCVGPNGILKLGNNFMNSLGVQIITFDRIEFGDDCLLSWDTLIMDTDFHQTIKNGVIDNNYTAPIIIGNNSWIGCRSMVLKGVKLPKNTIVAAGTTVTSSIDIEASAIGSNPQRIIKTNIKKL